MKLEDAIWRENAASSVTFGGRLENFSKNLRLLCSFHRSVADLCRRIGMNRQQFNKYLAGCTQPSASNLRLISSYFSLQSDDLFLSPEEFRRRVEERQEGPRKKDRLDSLLSDAFPGELRRLRPMLGRYHSYYPVQNGRLVCRALVSMYEEGGMVYTKLVERTNSQTTFRRNYLSKYDGLVSYLSNRLFILEFETLTRDAISQTILTPSYRKRLDVLTGLVIGMGADTRRQPFTSRIAWKSIPQSASTRDALSMCGFLSSADKSIDPTIRTYLNEGVPRSDYSE